MRSRPDLELRWLFNLSGIYLDGYGRGRVQGFSINAKINAKINAGSTCECFKVDQYIYFAPPLFPRFGHMPARRQRDGIRWTFLAYPDSHMFEVKVGGYRGCRERTMYYRTLKQRAR